MLACAPQPGTVLFDDRPQNQRIDEAEERMRNPAPLQWEEQPDGSMNAVDPVDMQPERYCSAIDPTLLAIHARTVERAKRFGLDVAQPEAPAEPSVPAPPNKTCRACDGEGLLYDTPGEPYCQTCGGCGEVAGDGSMLHVLSHGTPAIGDRRGFKTGDTVRLKDREGHNVGTIREETRWAPTDGKGPVFHFDGNELSGIKSCTVRPHEIERCDSHGVSLYSRAVLGEGWRHG
jgi:hypothetical protein